MFGFTSFYSILFLFMIALCFIMNMALSGKRNRNSVVFEVLTVVMFLVSALRGYSVGGDLYFYFRDFQDAIDARSLSDFFSVSNKEPGFTFIVWVISLSKSQRFYLICTSLLSLVGPFFIIKKYSRWPVISLLLLFIIFYTNTFNNVRQSIAISLTCFSCDMLIRKKNIAFCLLTMISSTVHFTALIFLLAYLLKKLKLSFKKIALIYFMGLLVYKFVLTDFLSFVVEMYMVKYNDGYLTDRAGNGYGLTLFYFIISVFLYYLFRKVDKRMPTDAYNINKLFLLFIIILPLLQLWATQISTLTRLTTYFYLYVIILIPNLLSAIAEISLKRIGCVMILSAYFIMACMTTYARDPETGSNGQAVIPYYIGNY